MDDNEIKVLLDDIAKIVATFMGFNSVCHYVAHYTDEDGKQFELTLIFKQVEDKTKDKP